ncbi:15967_t:CDS:2, partial [Racocetra persica]
DQPKRSKTPTPSDNNNNLQPNKVQPEQKNLVKKSDDQPKRSKTLTRSDNNNNLQPNKAQSEQQKNLIKKSNDQPKRSTTPVPSDNNNLQPNKAQLERQKNLIKPDNFIEELFYAELSFEVSSETKKSEQIEEIDESEEALIVEWLIGTGLVFEKARPIIQDELDDAINRRVTVIVAVEFLMQQILVEDGRRMKNDITDLQIMDKTKSLIDKQKSLTEKRNALIEKRKSVNDSEYKVW